MRTRATLRRLFNDWIDLSPGDQGPLWTQYSLSPGTLLVKGPMPEIVVAGAGFEPATFGL